MLSAFRCDSSLEDELVIPESPDADYEDPCTATQLIVDHVCNVELAGVDEGNAQGAPAESYGHAGQPLQQQHWEDVCCKVCAAHAGR